MQEKIPMRLKNYQSLQQELFHLENAALREVAVEIGAAAALGDRSENAEYAAAKEKQAKIQFRIASLKHKMSCAEVIDVSTLKDISTICFGATVSFVDLETDQQHTYTIVGEEEANFELGLLSISAPLARAFLGKKEAHEVVFRTPSGDVREYQILTIAYEEELKTA